MKFLVTFILLCVFVLWETVDAGCGGKPPLSCNNLESNAPSGVYKIQPRGIFRPIEVYCERASTLTGGRPFTFLPRSITRRPDAQRIVNALFTDRKNVLLKLQKKSDRSEAYTLIQPQSRFARINFGVLVNHYTGYTRPLNHFMRDYLLLGILPSRISGVKIRQGFKSNGRNVEYKNCHKGTNSYFALLPNHNQQTPSAYHKSNLVYERRGVAVDWRRTARPITNPDRMMPNEFFFFTELHFGGCGTYTSSDRWNRFGYHATAIGIR